MTDVIIGISFISSLCGIILIVAGALIKYCEGESNSVGWTGVALLIVGLGMAYGRV